MMRAATASDVSRFALGVSTAPTMLARLARGEAGLWLFVSAFFFAVLPFATQFVVHYPDERHYRDAAMEMIASGDYLTPRTSEEPLRLRKPIVTYWLVAASYHLLGISPAASRLPFLLGACGIVWLTYRLARLLTASRTTAQLAALIAVCHPSLWVSSCRSLPDIPLCLFLLLGAYGFVGILIHDRPTPRWLCAAYVGSGLAVATKGLPAAALVVTALVFIAFQPRVLAVRNWKTHTPWMALGALLGGAWFAVMAALHGEQLFAAFVDDQVQGRVTGKLWRPPLQFVQYTLLLVVTFLPWLTPLRHVNRGSIFGIVNGDDGRHRAVRFLIVWCATYLGLASCVNGASLRYVLPIVPLVAVLLATAIHAVVEDCLSRWARRLRNVALSMLLISASLAVAVAIRSGGLAMALPLLCIACGTVIFSARHGNSWRWTSSLQVAVLALLAMFSCTAITIRPLALPELGDRIWQELDPLHATGRPIALVGDSGLASRLRLYTQGAEQVCVCDGQDPELLAEHWHTIVLVDSGPTELDSRSFQLHQFTHGWKGVRLDEALRALTKGEYAAFEAAHRRTITIAIRKNDVVTSARESVHDRQGDRSVDRANRAALSRG